MADFMQSIVKIELHTKTVENIAKSKRHEYSRGGYKLEETIKRTTVAEYRALLECGHWRIEHHSGTNISTAQNRLQCFECSTLAYKKRIGLE